MDGVHGLFRPQDDVMFWSLGHRLPGGFFGRIGGRIKLPGSSPPAAPMAGGNAWTGAVILAAIIAALAYLAPRLAIGALIGTLVYLIGAALVG
jgi:hypothetical protein